MPNMIKNQLILFIILSLLVNCSLVFGEERALNSISSEMEEQINLLATLKIIEEASFDPNKIVSRGEFTTMIVKVLNANEITVSSKNTFNDLEAGAAVTQAIVLAGELGILSGVAEGNFAPDEPITVEQAAKMLVVTLGWNEIALQNGGYPTGYLGVANQIGVLGKKTTQERFLTQSSVVQLLYNTMHASILEQISYGAFSKYSSSNGKTLLEVYHDVYCVEGIVTGNFITKLTRPSSNLSVGNIEINGETYHCKNNDYIELIGYSVKAWYKSNKDDINEILYVNVANTDVTKILSDSILNIDNNKIYYELDNTRIGTVYIDNGIPIIYNGKAYPECNILEFKEINGSLTLLDQNKDGVFEVIIVDDYQDFIVEAVNAEKGIMYTKNGTIKNFGIEDKKNIVSIIINGDATDFYAVNEWMVATVRESRNVSGGKKYQVILSDSKEIGIIDELNIDNNKISINGKVLRLSKHYSEKLRVGDSGKFFLNCYDEVAGHDLDMTSNQRYGYIVAASIKSGIDNTLEIKILDQNGKNYVLPVCKNIIIDNVQIKNDSLRTFQMLCENGNVKQQLVIYGLNFETQITYINTSKPDENADAAGQFHEIFNPDNIGTVITDGQDWYREGTNIYGGKFWFDPKAVFFEVPSIAGITDEQEFSVRTITEIFGSSAKRRDFSAYGIKGDYTILAGVIQTGGASLRQSTPLMLVERVNRVIDEDRGEIYRIHGLYEGAKTAFSSTKEQVKNLKCGDIIRISANAEGYIESFKKAYVDNWDEVQSDSEITAPEHMQAGSLFGNFHLVYGVAREKFGNKLVIDTKTASGVETYIIIDCTNAIVMEYNQINQKIDMTTVKDVITSNVSPDEATEVVFRTYNGDVKEIVLFR